MPYGLFTSLVEEEGKGKAGEADEKHLVKCGVLEWGVERLRFSQGDRAVEGLKPGRCWADKGPLGAGNQPVEWGFPLSHPLVQWQKGPTGPQGSLSHLTPTSQPRVTLPHPPTMAKVVVSCFLSINTGMFQRWALSLPGPGPPHSGCSCPGTGSGRTSAISPTHLPSCLSCPLGDLGPVA